MATTSENNYNIIIAGGGAAGLSLAFRLLNSSLSHMKVLIIDKDEKKSNDRTWSFWSIDDEVFPGIIYKSWNNILIKNEAKEKIIDISPYRYQMIRGIDFYRFVKSEIVKNSNFKIIREEVKNIADGKDMATVETIRGSYTAELVFNSIPGAIPATISTSRNYLLQHFKGYTIKTPESSFSPDLVHFMDFSVNQENQTRFGYVLPFDETTALVEFTIFSENLLVEQEYVRLLNNYILNNLAIKNYQILEQEFGVIPMTDIRIEKKEGKRIFNIGSRGGMTKASTGYTFKQIQNECNTIVKKLEKHFPDLPVKPLANRFRFYDSVLLHVLAGNLYPGNKVFSLLFSRNKAQKILKFLEEKTNLYEDLGVLTSLPSGPFMKGALRALFNKGIKKNIAKISIEQRYEK